ncbi:MAG: acyl-CoA thioesterase [Flavobacteriaceae bacterium]
MQNRYTQEIEVRAEHLDDLAHVNNVQYLSWVQDIAKEHWNTLASHFHFEGIWVVREHRITYKKQAVLGDRISIQTFIKNARGPLSERIVHFTHATTDELFVECSTQWCLLDPQSFRPMRVPEEVSLKLGL